MSRAPYAFAVFLAAFVAFACASPAQAGLRLCNRTSYILYASTGDDAGNKIVTHGWIRIAPGTCETAIPGELKKDAYYAYARTSQAHEGVARAWGGKTTLCIEDNNFTLETPRGARCTEDAFDAPFMTIDTKGKTDWTTTFTQSPDLKTAGAARDAGLKRLLHDAGYKITGPDAVAKSLALFRVRMNMPDGAPPADLFDALETEALKVAAPAGYSVCNDTDAPAWAALGLRNGDVWGSRGWWKIEPGACAHMLTTKLNVDEVYLLVEGKAGKPIVSGPATFCVTAIAFDIERRTRCKERGLKSAGFALTHTRDRDGYAAHVSEDGLLPPLRRPQ